MDILGVHYNLCDYSDKTDLFLRGGNTKGSCFGWAAGGRCSGTPRECQDCNKVTSCTGSSPKPDFGPKFEERCRQVLVGGGSGHWEEECHFVRVDPEERRCDNVCFGSEEELLAFDRSHHERTRRSQFCREVCGPVHVPEKPRSQPTGNQWIKLSQHSSSSSSSSLVKEVPDGTCVTTCDNWPHAQCKV